MTEGPPREPATLFVGLGMMGGPMALRYCRTRRTLVHDVSPQAVERVVTEGAAQVWHDLADIPEQIDVVILMLPSTAVVESVVLEQGLLTSLKPGALVIDMGSSEPSSTRGLARRADELGIDFVDAPVSGGVVKAQDGTLAILMGGSEQARRRARAHVEPMGSRVLEVGGPGSGHAAKALNNWLSAANIAAAGEILSIAVLFGIDADVMVDVINASTGRSQATEVKYPNHILPGTYDSRFAFDLMAKDLRIGHGLAEQNEAVAPVLSSVLLAVEQARAFYDKGGMDHTELARFCADRNGVSFQRRP
jgi:3-hydroxyisobutyrate dehydrogenase